MRPATAELSGQSSRRTSAVPEILSFCCSAIDCMPLDRSCSTHPLRDRQELFPGKHDRPLTVSAREHQRFPATDSSQRTRRIRSQHTQHRSVHRVSPTTHSTQTSRLSCPALPAGQDGAHSHAETIQPSRWPPAPSCSSASKPLQPPNLRPHLCQHLSKRKLDHAGLQSASRGSGVPLKMPEVTLEL